MNQVGFKGISFPFRFNGRGGVASSTTTPDDFSHIKEGLMQIIGTSIGERVCETTFGSEVRSFNFQNQDDPIEISRLKFYVEDAVKKWDSRVSVLNVTVTPATEAGMEGVTYVDVDFYVSKYLKQDSVSVKIEK